MKNLKTALLLWAMMMALPMMAQDRKISGILIDSDSKEPVIQASVQLLATDSSYVAGAISNDEVSSPSRHPKTSATCSAYRAWATKPSSSM